MKQFLIVYTDNKIIGNTYAESESGTLDRAAVERVKARIAETAINLGYPMNVRLLTITNIIPLPVGEPMVALDPMKVVYGSGG